MALAIGLFGICLGFLVWPLLEAFLLLRALVLRAISRRFCGAQAAYYRLL